MVTPWNESKGVLDCELERRGFTRQVAIKTPSMLSAPFIIADSDLLMALPRSAAEKFKQAARITIFALPFTVAPFEVKIYSHKRSGKRGAAQWLQKVLKALSHTQTTRNT